ncbi:MAG: hypothetical protein WBE97_13930 [Candidatus Acidiferrales bacterium]
MTLARPFFRLSIVGLCGLMMVTALGPTAGAQNSNGTSGGNMWPHGDIDRVAALEKAGDESSVRALVDAVFNHPHMFPHMPPALEDAVKVRLTNAEMSYLNGSAGGVEEKDIVTLLNTLAEKLGAPDYAKTSPAQVRYARMKLAAFEPRFMGTGMVRQGGASVKSVSLTMSPAQAVHLIGLMIDNKLANPQFQVPLDTWVPPIEVLGPTTSTQSTSGTGQGRVSINPSTPQMEEMRSVLSNGISRLSLSDATQLLDQAFATLKMK